MLRICTLRSYLQTYLKLITMTLQEMNPAGWIIDLRGNSGGNMYPMLAGLSSLLGEGVLGYDVYPDGRSMLLTDSILRLRYRNGFLTPELMIPGTIYELTISLSSTLFNLFS